MPDTETDVPSPINLRSEPEAREWTRTAMLKRPWRTDFFARIADELRRVSDGPPAILELGSGPGFLAEHILAALPASTYTALDFSPAMHALARERLGVRADRVTFIDADFRVADWAARLPMVDAVVTMQAVHELRHKRHAAGLYKAVRMLLRPSGVLLTCDHMIGPEGMTDAALFMTVLEHDAALRAGGFSVVELIRQKAGLALFRAHG